VNGFIDRVASALKGHPHPGQRYRHGWIPVAPGGAATRDLSPDEQDLADELRGVGATVHPDGTVRAYHHTTPAAAASVRASGLLRGDEDGVFFTTKPGDEAQAAGRGGAMLTFDVPLHAMHLDDLFDDEAHVRVPLRRAGDSLDVSRWLVEHP
jgi:hypothetical protein